ncbi:MAG: DUF937 domain-containing protein [Gillisia sp.]
MASVLDLLNTSAGKELINKIQNKTSENSSGITSVLGMALPALLGAVHKNIQEPQGAEKLNNALEDQQHGEGFLKNLSNIPSDEIAEKGNKILQHILGDRKEQVTKTISGMSQVKESSVADIIKMAAPVVMSLLASQKRKDNVGTSGLQGLVQSVLGASGKHDHSLIETMLDKNKDGSVIDDVSGMILGGNKKNNGKGGILGGMLGGK